MFFPIDRRINERFPYATVTLITLNVAAFLWVYLAARDMKQLEELFMTFGVVPDNIRTHAVITHMFMHAGIPHITGNMLFLALFGMNVERKAGAPLYLLLYFLSGLSSLGLFLLLNPRGDMPLVGASGAISGVCGMYLVFFARRIVDVYWYALLWGGFAKAPAFAFILLWFGMEVLQAVLMGKHVMVAHWAHVGGFLGGFLLLLTLQLTGYKGHPETVPVEPSSEPDFKELEFIPEAQRSLPETNIRRRVDLQTCMLVAQEYRALGDAGPPDCVLGGLAFADAEEAQRRFAAQGYPTTIAVERYRVNVPLLALGRRVEAAGLMLRFHDELGRAFHLDPRLLFHTSAGRVGMRRYLDLFLTGPWTDYRILDADPETAKFVRDRFGTGLDREAGTLREYDAYLMWELQRKASALRSRSSAAVAAPPSAPPAPPPDGR